MAVSTIFQNELTQWIDVTEPTKELLEDIGRQYHIDEYLLEDSIDPDHLPKFEQSGNIKFFLTRENRDLERDSLKSISDISTKLSIFILPGTIITIHRLPSLTISNVQKEIFSYPAAEYETFIPDDIALMLALEIIKSFDEESKKLFVKMDVMEREVFMENTPRKNLIRGLYRLKRKAGLNTRILSLSSGWLNQFRLLNLKDVELADLYDKQRDVLSDFDHLSSQVNNLISMHLAMSDQRANQVMKLLAMYSVYFLPLTFIAGVYGMNFDNIPELHHPMGYFAVLALMLIIVVVTFIYFQKKKWGE